jgi:5-methylcytosine-specific restriction protein A
MSKNPDWTRDELILALGLYFRAGRKQLDAAHPEVVQLSQILNRLPIHASDLREADFRNPQGVSMKLGNFLSIDPDYEGVGLKRGSKLDREVWNEFAHNIDRLKLTAASIGKNIGQIAEARATYNIGDEEEEFAEGKILTRLHKRKERNRKAIEQKKRKVLAEIGKLACEACDFDFALMYGNLGYGFAECHHTVPVSELGESHKTRLTDLAIVCANCHRMIHKSRPMMSIEQLRNLIESQCKA